MRRKIKGIYLVVAMALMSGTLASTALAEERPTRVISVTGAGLVQLYEEKVDLGDAIFRGAIGLEFEKVTSPSSGFYITPAVSFGRKALGVRATLGLKNYFEPTAPEGLWWGVYLTAGLGADWGPQKDWGVSVSTVGGGVNLGYRYLLPKNFTAEWSFGAIYLSRSGEDIDVGGVGPRIEVKFGYAF